jgi:Transposase
VAYDKGILGYVISLVDGDLIISFKKYMQTLNANSIVVGVDVHKYSHTAVAMNAWGEDRGTLNFTNNNLETYTEWLEQLGLKENIVIGLEDVNSYGIHLVENLRRKNYHIRYVPAILTERERKASTKRHKSDSVDAKRVGKVILHKYEETLPAKESIADTRELEIITRLTSHGTQRSHKMEDDYQKSTTLFDPPTLHGKLSTALSKIV